MSKDVRKDEKTKKPQSVHQQSWNKILTILLNQTRRTRRICRMLKTLWRLSTWLWLRYTANDPSRWETILKGWLIPAKTTERGYMPMRMHRWSGDEPLLRRGQEDSFHGTDMRIRQWGSKTVGVQCHWEHWHICRVVNLVDENCVESSKTSKWQGNNSNPWRRTMTVQEQ